MSLRGARVLLEWCGCDPSIFLPCAARDLAYPAGNGNLIIAALRARGFAARRCLGRLRGVRQGGAGYGAAPPSRPPLHPPRSTPEEGYQHPLCCEGTRLKLRELPSLTVFSQAISLRAA